LSQFQATMTLVTDGPTSKATQIEPHTKAFNLDNLTEDSKSAMHSAKPDACPNDPEIHTTIATASAASKVFTKELVRSMLVTNVRR
jgi:hypothetical protein